MDKRTVTMTKTTPGSEDGIRVQLYKQDGTYEIGAALAQSFIQSKCARPVAIPEPSKEQTGGDTPKRGKGPAENK